jgi:hypothetical protein
MQPLVTTLLRRQQLNPAQQLIADLPVNPLYCVDIHITAAQKDPTTTTDVAPTAPLIANALQRVEVLYRGTTILSVSGLQLWALCGAISGKLPIASPHFNAAGTAHATQLRIYLGHPMLGPQSAFPATRRGELTLRLTPNPTPPFIDPDQVAVTITTTELLEHTPENFLKVVEITKTIPAAGDHDVDLPMGNPIFALLFQVATPYGHPANPGTISNLKLLVDNVETFVAEQMWENLAANWQSRTAPNHYLEAHTHVENLAAAYTQDERTAKADWPGTIADTFALMTFDPWGRMETFLDTMGRGRVHLRVTATLAEQISVIPLELINLPKE